MATRLYLPSAGTSPLPSQAVASSWESSASAFFRAPTGTSKSDSSLADKAGTFPSTATQQMCHGQWVSPPLNAFSFLTSHTISMVIRGLEGAVQVDGHLAYTVRVVSGDGSTVRGTIAEYHAISTELLTTAATRIHSARVLNSAVSAQAGDRLVIEIGTHGVTPITTSTATWRFGDPSATSDFALTAALTTDLCPWVELSPDLTFQDPQTVTVSGVASAGAVGTVTAINQNQVCSVTGVASAGAVGGMGVSWEVLSAISAAWKGLDISTTGQILLGAANSYLRRSTDGGESWSTLEPAGSGAKSYSESAMSDDGEVIVASIGVPGRCYLSVNGGSSWSQIQPKGDVDTTWGALFVSGDGSVVYSSCDSRIYKTVVGGSTTEIQPYGNVDTGAAIDNISCSEDGSTVIIGCAGTASTYNGLMYSTNSGTSWTTAVAGDTRSWTGVMCNSDGTLLGGSRWTSFYLSSDGGSFNTVTTGATAPADPRAGTDTILLLSAKILFISFDRGVSWEDTSPMTPAFTWEELVVASNDSCALANAINTPYYLYKMTVGGSVVLGGAPAGQTAVVTGVASGQAVGSVTVLPGGVERAVTGVGSSELVGTVTVVFPQTKSVTGVTSAEVTGTVEVLKGGVTRATTGIASEELIGTVAVAKTNLVAVTGIASGEAVGSAAVLTGGVERAVTGVSSGEDVGTVAAVSSDEVAVDGVESGELTGSVTVLRERTVAVSGVTTGEVVGTATTVHMVSVTGVSSAEAVGSVSRLMEYTAAVSGVSSAEAVGAVTVDHPLTKSVTGVPSSEAVGTPTLLKERSVSVSGVTSSEAVGSVTTAQEALGQAVPVTGVPSGERIGRESYSGWDEIDPTNGVGAKTWAAIDQSSDGRIVVACNWTTAFTGRMYGSVDHGHTWQILSTAGGNYRGIACSDNGRYMVSVTNDLGTGTGRGKVRVSSNYGYSWTVCTDYEFNADLRFALCGISGNGAVMVVGVYPGRFFVSTDYGATWFPQEPAGDVDRNWTDVALNYDGSVIIAGCTGTNGRLWKSTNSGSTWAELRPLGNVDQNWLSIDCDTDASTIILGRDSTVNVYFSTDSGTSWGTASPLTAYAVACSGDDGSLMLAGAGSSLGRLRRSENSGVDWEETQPYGAVDKYWRAISVDDDDQVFAFGARSTDQAGWLVRSITAGDTYTGLIITQNVSATGVASGEQVGSVTAIHTQTVGVAGVVSGETVGSVEAYLAEQYRAVTGIGSAEAIGSVSVEGGGAITRAATGIDSAEAVGTVTLALGGVTVDVTGVGSGESVGTATAALADSTVDVTGVASSEAVGIVTVVAGGITFRVSVERYYLPPTIPLSMLWTNAMIHDVVSPEGTVTHARFLTPPDSRAETYTPADEGDDWTEWLPFGGGVFSLGEVPFDARWTYNVQLKDEYDNVSDVNFFFNDEGVWDTEVVLGGGAAVWRSKTVRLDIWASSDQGDATLIYVDDDGDLIAPEVEYVPNQPAEEPDHMSLEMVFDSWGTKTVTVIFMEYEGTTLWEGSATIELAPPSSQRTGVLRVHSVLKRTAKSGVLRVAPKVKRK